MKAFFKNYWKYVREGSTGLAIAPFSSALWHSFIDSLVDVVMTLITFAFLLACWCIYPIAVLFFALAACESERRSAKQLKEWRDGHLHSKKCEKGSSQGLSGWYCSRDKGHDGPCALHRIDE